MLFSAEESLLWENLRENLRFAQIDIDSYQNFLLKELIQYFLSEAVNQLRVSFFMKGCRPAPWRDTRSNKLGEMCFYRDKQVFVIRFKKIY